MQKYKGQSLIAITVIVAILALILRFAIGQIVKMNIAQNESYASKTLKLISVALENYAAAYEQVYPDSLSVLTATNPAYLDKDYVASSPLRGYNYNCLRLQSSGYNCEAVPVKCKITGKMAYTVTTGGVFLSEDCAKKE